MYSYLRSFTFASSRLPSFLRLFFLFFVSRGGPSPLPVLLGATGADEGAAAVVEAEQEAVGNRADDVSTLQVEAGGQRADDVSTASDTEGGVVTYGRRKVALSEPDPGDDDGDDDDDDDEEDEDEEDESDEEEEDDNLLRAEALYDFAARNENEISFTKGEVLIVHEKDTSGWWKAEVRRKRKRQGRGSATTSGGAPAAPAATIGVVPSNYLRVLYKAPSFNFKLSSKVNLSIRELQKKCGFITPEDTKKTATAKDKKKKTKKKKRKTKKNEDDDAIKANGGGNGDGGDDEELKSIRQRSASISENRAEMIAGVQALLLEQRGFLARQKELLRTRTPTARPDLVRDLQAAAGSSGGDESTPTGSAAALIHLTRSRPTISGKRRPSRRLRSAHVNSDARVSTGAGDGECENENESEKEKEEARNEERSEKESESESDKEEEREGVVDEEQDTTSVATMMQELQWRLEKAEEVIEANRMELEMATEKEMILRLEMRSLSLESKTSQAEVELERERAAELAARVEALAEAVREREAEIALWRASSRTSARAAENESDDVKEKNEDGDANKEKCEGEEAQVQSGQEMNEVEEATTEVVVNKKNETVDTSSSERLMEEIMARNRRVEELELEVRERGEVIEKLMMEVRAREEEKERERERADAESWWTEERRRLLGLIDAPPPVASEADVSTAPSAPATATATTSTEPAPAPAEPDVARGNPAELAELRERAQRLEAEKAARREEEHIGEELIRLQAQLIAHMVGMVAADPAAATTAAQPSREDQAAEVRQLLEELDYLARKRQALLAARKELAAAADADGGAETPAVRARRATTVMATRRRSIFPTGAAPPPLPSLPSLASSLAEAATSSAADGAADVSKPEKDEAARKVADHDDEEEARPTVVIGDKRDSGGRERSSKRLSSPLSPPPPDGPLMRAKEKKIRKLTAKLAKKKLEGRGAHTTEVPVAAAPEWVLDVMVPECVGCHAQFTLIKRRHHCRNCGKVFCGKCTSLSCSIEELGYTEPVRVCQPCFTALHTHQPVAAGGGSAAAQPPHADTGGGGQ